MDFKEETLKTVSCSQHLPSARLFGNAPQLPLSRLSPSAPTLCRRRSGCDWSLSMCPVYLPSQRISPSDCCGEGRDPIRDGESRAGCSWDWDAGVSGPGRFFLWPLSRAPWRPLHSHRFLAHYVGLLALRPSSGGAGRREDQLTRRPQSAFLAQPHSQAPPPGYTHSCGFVHGK